MVVLMIGSISHGDAILTAYVRDERPEGWRSFKAPKGRRFVFLLLGTVDKDAAGFDVDGALNELGWHYGDTLVTSALHLADALEAGPLRDSDRLPKGEDAGTAAECEASQSGAGTAIAQPPEITPQIPSEDTPNAS
jgi:hypothetical protein